MTDLGSDNSPANTGKLSFILIASLLLFAIMAIYFNSLPTRFYYDDYYYIKDNPGISKTGNFADLFSRESYFRDFREGTYRPVTSFIYMLLKHVNGDTPVYWRLFNLFIHFVNCCLLFLLIRRYLSDWQSLLAVLIFAVHTVHTEIINVISFNEDLLGGLFCLLSIHCYLRKNNYLKVASVFLYGLACFTKETFIVLPVLVVILAWYELDAREYRSRKIIIDISGYLLVASVFLVIYFHLMKNPNPAKYMNYPGGSLLAALLTFSVVLLYYLKLLIFPLSLTLIYNFTVYKSFLAVAVWSSLFCLGLIAVIIGYGFRKKESFAIFLSWFFIFLLPTSNLIPYGAILAERYLYFPLMGLIPGVILLVNYICKYFELDFAKYLYFVGIIFILFLSVLTIRRNRVWRNPVALWQDTLASNPNSVGIRVNLGLAYYERERYQEAITPLEEATLIDPLYPNPYSNLGKVYLKLNRYNEAIDNIKKALSRRKRYVSRDNYYDDLLNLGVAYYQLKDYRRASRFWEAARNLSPGYSGTYQKLALVYEKLGLLEEAAQARNRYQSLKAKQKNK